MKHFIPILTIVSCLFFACAKQTEQQVEQADMGYYTAADVQAEMERCWQAYRTYAWGDDVLLPLSKGSFNWYEESLGISPFDAYSTLGVMGMDEEAQEVLEYALEKDWDQDIYVQVFEVNIRILGGLLAMYDHSRDERVLAKAIDFGDRILPAFNSPSGLPYHSVNLKTGATAGNRGEGKGNNINVAQAATYLVEFGILSYYAKDPTYYQAAKRASKYIYDHRSALGLPGDQVDVETGDWTNNWTHLQAGVDSYYEYLYKASILFGDEELKHMWDTSLIAINTHLTDELEGRLYYTIVDMHTGEVKKRSVSLYDAFFPAMQALSGNMEAAEANQASWDWLWNQYGLLPTRYNYGADTVEYGNSELNPEIIESAYYLHQLTGEEKYQIMLNNYWIDLNTCCRDSIAFHAIHDVRSMKPRDYLATYFFAETLKYFYLAAAGDEPFSLEEVVFNTEAHPFMREHFDPVLCRKYLGFE